MDYKAMHQKTREVMASLGQEVDPRKPAGTFGMGVQQMIEIAKAVLIDAKMIIMDEPTSSLGGKRGGAAHGHLPPAESQRNRDCVCLP